MSVPIHIAWGRQIRLPFPPSSSFSPLSSFVRGVRLPNQTGKEGAVARRGSRQTQFSSPPLPPFLFRVYPGVYPDDERTNREKLRILFVDLFLEPFKYHATQTVKECRMNFTKIEFPYEAFFERKIQLLFVQSQTLLFEVASLFSAPRAKEKNGALSGPLYPPPLPRSHVFVCALSVYGTRLFGVCSWEGGGGREKASRSLGLFFISPISILFPSLSLEETAISPFTSPRLIFPPRFGPFANAAHTCFYCRIFFTFDHLCKREEEG